METSEDIMKNNEGPFLLFLNAMKPLEGLPLCEDTLDALAHSNITNYAPAILSVICDWMVRYSTHELLIRASSTNTLNFTSSSTILYCLEQLPSLMKWLNTDDASSVFGIDIATQGEEQLLEFFRSGKQIRLTHIITPDWAPTRNMSDEEYSISTLRTCCRMIAQEIARTAIAMNANIEALPKFRNWCLECGYKLK
ncbi:hypothetical protein [Gimesia sp.]|uniref:hypothetical protein n=1 Tax=Gimesia sp. TaxID=2024833 RepID=UPI000C48FE38|nr:hypothetical protein [Gimesia sp.]MAX37527.1 hypothetical protein [Gimesia sp.]HAH44605.1 hypothetical protein [Planctomycetaceae bacterium]|tara:strand:- start:7716 stop:8303 length:588 start_codon:yes stop_codon:yes gene_type:complete